MNSVSYESRCTLKHCSLVNAVNVGSNVNSRAPALTVRPFELEVEICKVMRTTSRLAYKRVNRRAMDAVACADTEIYDLQRLLCPDFMSTESYPEFKELMRTTGRCTVQ